MRTRSGTLLAATVVAMMGGLLLFSPDAPGQTTTTFKAPRTPDGKPNLNGIWQAMNTAHWNLESHPAAAGPMWQLGAQFAIPRGVGVVEGDTKPYKPSISIIVAAFGLIPYIIARG